MPRLTACAGAEGTDQAKQLARFTSYMEAAADFLLNTHRVFVWPGNDWSLRQCCVGRNAHTAVNRLILVDLESVSLTWEPLRRVKILWKNV